MHVEALRALDARGIRRPAGRSESALLLQTRHRVAMDVAACRGGARDSAARVAAEARDRRATYLLLRRHGRRPLAGRNPDARRQIVGPRVDEVPRLLLYVPAVRVEPRHALLVLLLREIRRVVAVGRDLRQLGVEALHVEVLLLLRHALQIRIVRSHVRDLRRFRRRRPGDSGCRALGALRCLALRRAHAGHLIYPRAARHPCERLLQTHTVLLIHEQVAPLDAAVRHGLRPRIRRLGLLERQRLRPLRHLFL